MERVVRVFASHEAAEEADLQDWQALTMAERIRAGEAIRREAFGDQPGFQRVLRVVEREGGAVPPDRGRGV